MFKNKLKDALKEIFQVAKVSYDMPGESREQDCLFVEIQNAKSTVRKTEEVATVRGTMRIYSTNERLPFGFFNKRLAQADPKLTQRFYFFNIDENTPTFGGLVERKCDFVYLYSNDYDPEGGQLTSVEFQEENES